MPKLSVDLAEEEYERFHKLCARKHRKHVGIIRYLIDQWLKGERQIEKPREGREENSDP